MECYNRCIKCGRRTASFEDEELLKEYSNDIGWGEYADGQHICDHCLEKMLKKNLKQEEQETNKIEQFTSFTIGGIIGILMAIAMAVLYLTF